MINNKFFTAMNVVSGLLASLVAFSWMILPRRDDDIFSQLIMTVESIHFVGDAPWFILSSILAAIIGLFLALIG